MSDPQPPYNVPVHPKYADTPLDEIPGAQQNRIRKYDAKYNPDSDITEPIRDVVAKRADELEPEEQNQAQTDPSPPTPIRSADDADGGGDSGDESDENVDASGDPMPEEEEFPYHKGGGYYVLSNGEVVRGEEKAEKKQAKL